MRLALLVCILQCCWKVCSAHPAFNSGEQPVSFRWGFKKRRLSPWRVGSWAKSNGQAAIIGECFTQFLEKVKFVFLFFQAFRVNYVS